RPGLAEGHRKRQPDIAEADHGDRPIVKRHGTGKVSVHRKADPQPGASDWSGALVRDPGRRGDDSIAVGSAPSRRVAAGLPKDPPADTPRRASAERGSRGAVFSPIARVRHRSADLRTKVRKLTGPLAGRIVPGERY